MIVIYAEKADMGCKFAAVLGGIPYHGKTLSLKEYESLPGEKQREVQRKGYVEFSLKNKDFIVTWGAGHFGTLLEPRDLFPDTKWKDYKLPIIPEVYRVKLAEKANKYQFKIVKDLFCRDDCEYIISATDYEREGELIFAYTYELTGTSKPYKRVRINETTQDGIKKGFSKRISNVENLPKEAGARVRGIADWLTGMNLTIAATTKLSSERVNLGRVITPTLAMIVNLEKEITSFVPKPFYTVYGDFEMPDGKTYRGKYNGEVFENNEDALALIRNIPSDAIVTKIEKKKGKKKPEKPFDTAALQKEANKKYKFPLKKIDEIAQSLYSRGFITYPRVDSRYLKEEQQAELPLKIKALSAIDEYRPYIDALEKIEIEDEYFNDKKVDAHHAIVITGNIPSSLTDDEWKIYDMIARQTIALAYPPVLLEKKIVTTIAGEHPFTTSGTTLIDPGWSVLGFESTYKDEVPAGITENMRVQGTYTSEEGKTTPPQRYTPGSLVRAMEICGRKVNGAEEKKLLEKMKGLGRPSTRANIVERLQNCDYIEIKKNIIHPTERGIQVIDVITLDSLKSPEMSAEWEKRIDEIEQSSTAECTKLASSFIKDISMQTKKWVKEIDAIASSGKRIASSASVPCPICSNMMKDAKYSFMCDCGFAINKEIAGHKLSAKEIESISKAGRTPFITNFRSKEGKAFTAYLVVKDGKLEFTKDSLLTCPKCRKPLRPFNSQKGYYCSGWSKDGEGCEFRLFREMYGRKLKANELKDLIVNGSTRKVELVNKAGKKYNAKIVLDEECIPRVEIGG